MARTLELNDIACLVEDTTGRVFVEYNSTRYSQAEVLPIPVAGVTDGAALSLTADAFVAGCMVDMHGTDLETWPLVVRRFLFSGGSENVSFDLPGFPAEAESSTPAATRPSRISSTPAEIRDIIQRRIGSSLNFDGACRLQPAPFVFALQEEDSTGCNWSVMPTSVVNPRCHLVIDEIVARVKVEYNLKSQST